MGFSTATIQQLAHVAPIPIEQELPPLISIESGETVWQVGLWDKEFEEQYEPDPLLKQIIRLIHFFWGVNLTPQAKQYIGPFSSEEKAKAACLDGNYYVFPMTLDKALPREKVNLAGLVFPKRWFHKLWWHGPPKAPIDPYVPVRQSELEEIEHLKAAMRQALNRSKRD